MIKNGEEEKQGEVTQDHSHLPDPRSVQTANVLHSLKILAKTDKKNARDLVVAACGTADEPTVAVLPKVKNLIRTVKRFQSEQTLCINPKTLKDLVLNDSNTTTLDDQKFLLFDNVGDETRAIDNRVVIFGTVKNLEILNSCDVLAMDGTFKFTPPLFKQLFTVHGTQANSCFLLQL